MGRPKSSAKRGNAYQFMLTDAEHEAFERLVETRRAELAAEGVEVTAPMVVRWLIGREIAARGIGGWHVDHVRPKSAAQTDSNMANFTTVSAATTAVHSRAGEIGPAQTSRGRRG